MKLTFLTGGALNSVNTVNTGTSIWVSRPI